MTGHDRSRRLTERAGLHVVGEIDDPAIRHHKIDDDGRTAEFRMGPRGGAWRREPSLPRNIARQIEDPVIIYVGKHRSLGKRDQMTSPHTYYIGSQGLANEIWQISRRNSSDNRPSGALFQGA